MLNLNSLYKAVFRPEYSRFDTVRNYYTIFMDTGAFSPLYQDFNDRIEYLLSADAYTYLHAPADGELTRDQVEEKLSQITETLDMRTNGAPPARRFCLLSYFDDEHQDIGTILRQLSWLNKENRDVVTLLVCLSKRMSGKVRFLEKLAETLGDRAADLDLYIFTDAHTTYYRRGLIHSLCGAIVMNSEVSAYQARKQRKNAAKAAVSQYTQSLGEDGKRYLATLNPIFWSSLFCKFYDRKLDFLHQYVADACANVRQITQGDFTGFVNDVYRTLIPNRDSLIVKSAMKKAIAQIPYVVPAQPKQSLSSLRAFIQCVYGDRGIDTVGLTLKATLSGIYNYRIDDLADKGGQRLFELCAAFGSPELDRQVAQLLDWYIGTLREACDSARRSLDVFLDDDMLAGFVDESFDTYLDKYLKYYEVQKMYVYWVEVRREIGAYPDRFSGYCRQSGELYENLRKLRESIPTGRVYQFEKLDVASFTAAELLALETNEAVCGTIRGLFGDCREDSKGVVAPGDCGPVFSIPISPQFSKTATVELSTNSYTICGCELNGQYFVSMGEEQDV